MIYQCKVCGYSEMPYPPEDYNICPCCGVEYRVDDAFESHEELRNNWLRDGAKWFSVRQPYVQPVDWNAWDQLDLAQLPYAVSRPEGIVKETSFNIPSTGPTFDFAFHGPVWIYA